MAATTLEAPTHSGNPASPVDLSTIPISPEGGNSPEEKADRGEDEQITVFHDPENFNVKHPLMHKWTLWFTKPPSGKVQLLSGKELIGHEADFPRATTGTIF
jgi:translation initiation factor 4E